MARRTRKINKLFEAGIKYIDYKDDKLLRRFISDRGYEIAGDHEEEYLTRPDAKVIKTLIRYEIKKKQ